MAEVIMLVAILSAIFVIGVWMKRIEGEIRFMEGRQQTLIEHDYWREYLEHYGTPWVTPTATPETPAGGHT